MTVENRLLHLRHQDATIRADEISGVQVIDARTLEIKIDAPKAYFLAKLTYPTAFVVDQQEVEANPRN